MHDIEVFVNVQTSNNRCCIALHGKTGQWKQGFGLGGEGSAWADAVQVQWEEVTDNYIWIITVCFICRLINVFLFTRV